MKWNPEPLYPFDIIVWTSFPSQIIENYNIQNGYNLKAK